MQVRLKESRRARLPYARPTAELLRVDAANLDSLPIFQNEDHTGHAPNLRPADRAIKGRCVHSCAVSDPAEQRRLLENVEAAMSGLTRLELAAAKAGVTPEELRAYLRARVNGETEGEAPAPHVELEA
jgi:hypothetical protein